MRGRLARTATAVALSVPMTGALLMAGAPAAGAAVTSPGNGTVFSTHASFTISADYGRSTSENRLALASPGGPAVTIASAPGNLNGGTLSYRFDTGCWTVGCSGLRPAPNGTWTVTQTGGGSGSTTFVTRIKPAAPSGLTASALSSREVRLSWRVGAEPDLIGYAVLEGSTVVQEIPRSACDSSSCSAVVTYASDGSGEHTYVVRASRRVEPGSSQTLESAVSAPASARLEAPAPPPADEPTSPPAAEGSGSGSGTGTETGGGTESGSGTGSGSTGSGSTGGGTTSPSGPSSARPSSAPAGGKPAAGSGGQAPLSSGTSSSKATADSQAVAQREAFALSYSAFGPKLGIPKLPPLPSTQAPVVAPEIADGTYDTTLPGFDQDQVYTEKVEVAQGPSEQVSSVVTSAFDSERLVRSSALALILLLAGAHLRRWLSAPHAEHAER